MSGVSVPVEEKEANHPLEVENENCDVVVMVGKKKLYFHSSILSSVSPYFKKQLEKQQLTSTLKQIALEGDVEPLNVIRALSYYYPKYFEEITDAAPFESLFTICTKFQLFELQVYLERYLQEKYSFRRPGYGSISLLLCLPILKLADKFQLVVLRKYLLSLSFDSSTIFGTIIDCDDFKSLQDATKYELIMKGIEAALFPNLFIPTRVSFSVRAHSIPTKLAISESSGEMLKLEKHALQLFFDILYYEKRTIDFTPPNKFEECKNTAKRIDNPFNVADDASVNRTIEVGDYQLHVSSVVLSENSPVLDRMLNGGFKEANEKVIRLEDDPVELILLFKHFYRYCEITDKSKDLLPLCRKYQVTWLLEKIKNYLTDHFTQCETTVALKYLQLADEFELTELRRKLLKSPCDMSFCFLQSNPSFNRLNNQTKYVLALYRMGRLLYRSSGSNYTPLCIRQGKETWKTDSDSDSDPWVLVRTLDALFTKKLF